MKKKIAFFLAIVIILTMGILTCNISAAPEATPAQQQQATSEENQQPVTIWDTKINLDGSAVTTILLYVPQEQLESPGFIENVTKQIEKSGYIPAISEKDGKKMLELKKEIKKGQELVFSLPELNVNFDVLTLKNFFNTMYIVTTGIDMRGAPPSQEFMKLTCNFPVSPKFTNAQIKEKGGAISTWSIKGDAVNSIKFAILVPNIINTLLIILIVFILFAVWFLYKKKKNQAIIAEEGESENNDTLEAENNKEAEEVIDEEEDLEELNTEETPIEDKKEEE
jgi:hypothetical protein